MKVYTLLSSKFFQIFLCISHVLAFPAIFLDFPTVHAEKFQQYKRTIPRSIKGDTNNLRNSLCQV